MHFTENFTYFITTFNINHHYQALPSIIKDAFGNMFYFLQQQFYKQSTTFLKFFNIKISINQLRNIRIINVNLI